MTPSGLPTVVRVAIGLTAWTAFLLYVFVVGRRAHRDGFTGDVAPHAAGDAAPVAG